MKPLTATLDSFEGDIAVLIFDDGQRLTVPKQNLPGFSEGDVISVSFLNDIDSQAQREKVLKGILNEVITTTENGTSEQSST